MTYIRRAFKYFIQLTLLFVVIVGMLMLIGYVPKDIAVAFRNGWDSIFLILGIFGLGIVSVALMQDSVNRVLQ